VTVLAPTGKATLRVRNEAPASQTSRFGFVTASTIGNIWVVWTSKSIRLIGENARMPMPLLAYRNN
jgi:hypothetical protein